MNLGTKSPSRRDFLKNSAMAAGLFLLEFDHSVSAQVAVITALQMRAEAATAKISVLPLRGGVTTLTGSGGNILVTSGTDGKLAVDSGFATSKAHIEAALAGISSEPLRHLINTHWHFDHTDGNEWMHKAGAQITAVMRTRMRMSRHQDIPAFAAVLPPSPVAALPTNLFSEKETLYINGGRVELKAYAPAHTDTDISVFFPEANVLHTGDTWFNGFYPFIDYDSGGDLQGLLNAASVNHALADQESIVVPGHGSPGNRNDLSDFQEMLHSIQHEVATQKKAGKPLQAVINSKPTARFDAKWAGGYISPALFVALVYRGA